MRTALAVLSVASAIASVTAFGSVIPLSPNSYSFQRGDPSSKITVELFIDLTCSSTQAAWPTLTRVYEAYKSSVNFQYHVFPLPYHQYSFAVSKAAQVVDAYGDEGAVFTYFDTAFENQAQIYNSATSDQTYDEVVAYIGTWATAGTGVTDEQYVAGMKDDDLEMATRYTWKYCTLRGVYGTPLYFINGVQDQLATFKQWSDTLESLLAQTNAKTGSGKGTAVKYFR